MSDVYVLRCFLSTRLLCSVALFQVVVHVQIRFTPVKSRPQCEFLVAQDLGLTRGTLNTCSLWVLNTLPQVYHRSLGVIGVINKPWN